MQTPTESRDEEAYRLLASLGLARAEARALMHLARVESASSAEVEAATRLRQPEVSLAMRQLRERGWALQNPVRKKGKGRPAYVYRLARPFADLLSEIEQRRREAATRDAAAIERLRALALR